MKIGCDVVELERFRKRIGNPGALSRFMGGAEMTAFTELESIAGLWAMKEAAIKAGISKHMLELVILKREDGSPYVHSVGGRFAEGCSVSVSHDGGMVFAIALNLQSA